MAEIIVFDGYAVPKFTRSTAAKRSRTMSGKTKFKATAKKCNKKKGKAARKACWRKAYRK